MSETKKIGIACFIGGAVCVIIALLVNPMFWWLGLIAGFAAGYFAYEVKEVKEAIISAAVLVGILGVCGPIYVIGTRVEKFIKWSKSPHPSFYLTAFISFASFAHCRSSILETMKSYVSHGVLCFSPIL